MKRPGGVSTGWRSLSAVGVLAAAVLAVSVNVLTARFYHRWDVTPAGLYTLSPATVETLTKLTEPIDVVVLLSQSDNLTVSVRQMLVAYGAETQQLRVRYVDPDRSPAEFLALQSKYGLQSGKTEDGRLVSDASIVVSRGERRWFVTTSDMVVVDEEDGRVRPRLEQALTEALRNVLEQVRSKVCFSTGHQEQSIDDGGPQGAAELRYRLERNNYEVAAVDFSEARPSLKGCDALVVAGAEEAFAPAAAKLIEEYLRGGGNVALLLNPGLDDDGRIRPTGLEPVARAGGVEFGEDFLIEAEERLRLPQGLGETFLATPREHRITQGFLLGDKVRYRVLLSAAQSLRAGSPAGAQVLLESSPRSFSLKDVRPFVEGGRVPEKGAADPAGPFPVAMVAELPKPAGSSAQHGPRLLVVGSANVSWSRVFREPALLGTRLFLESGLAWLVARQAIVSVPEKPLQDVGLSLTEESLSDVRLYVLLYMPLAAALIGGATLYRRRSLERRSRREQKPKAKAS